MVLPPIIATFRTKSQSQKHLALQAARHLRPPMHHKSRTFPAAEVASCIDQARFIGSEAAAVDGAASPAAALGQLDHQRDHRAHLPALLHNQLHSKVRPQGNAYPSVYLRRKTVRDKGRTVRHAGFRGPKDKQLRNFLFLLPHAQRQQRNDHPVGDAEKTLPEDAPDF
jgi:hypothetical protein